MIVERLRDLSFAALTLVAISAALTASSTQALAQYSPAAPAPQSTNPNPVCARLEGQLAAVDRGGNDPARADQIHRTEDAINKQQADLDRTVAQGRRLGCDSSGFFSLFSSQNQQCGPLNQQISQMRANLAHLQSDLQRLQAGDVDSDNQRQGILVALAQNNCGPQYRSANTNQSGGLFGGLFGNNNGGFFGQSPDATQSNTYRTICVRTCDGFYFPISFATTQARFDQDQQQCQRMCPAAEVTLYTYHNPGEDVAQAVSLSGAPYTSMPNAFKYRQEFVQACSCRKPGQSWAQTLGGIPDDTVEQGDIVVNEQRSKAMAQPRVDAQGRPIRPDPRAGKPTAQAAPLPTSPGTDSEADQDPSQHTIRNVGPTFVPPR
jgi:hypothetical protein